MRTTAILLATTVTIAVLTGCQSQKSGIASPEAALATDEQSAGFLDRVSSGPTVSENDALRGILMLLEGKDTAKDFQQRVEALQKRNVVSSHWSLDAARPLTKGRLAYMVYQACGVRGGLTLTLTGPSERYCLRELQYQGFMANGTMRSQVTGQEFVGVLKRSEAYLESQEVPWLLNASKEGG